MTLELDSLRTKLWALAPGRYTSASGYMVTEGRTGRQSFGSGIKFFEGEPVGNLSRFNGDHITVGELRENYRVWRPEETIEAARVLKEKGRLLVVGRPQSGKGTILFGLSDICDKQGIGYAMIDGHWLDSPSGEVINAIQKAQAEGKMIFFDSFDYLFAGSTKLRKQNKEKHVQRTREIIDALKDTTVPLVLTAHDDYWAGLVLDKNLLNEHKDFLESLGIYNLPRYIESEESRLAFLVDHEYSLEEAYALLSVPNMPLVRDAITRPTGNGDYIQELELSLKDYGVLKRLARRSEGETHGIPDQVKSLLKRIENGDEEAAFEISHVILSLHFESDLAATLRWQK